MGTAFAKYAKSDSEDKKSRNRKNARKAYDSVLHLLAKATLTPSVRTEIDNRLAVLKSDLQSLGETF
jgi:hypothetical protein